MCCIFYLVSCFFCLLSVTFDGRYMYREIHLHSWISKYVHLLRLKRLFFFSVFSSSFLGKDTINKINMSMPVCVCGFVCVCVCVRINGWLVVWYVHIHTLPHTNGSLYCICSEFVIILFMLSFFFSRFKCSFFTVFTFASIAVAVAVALTVAVAVPAAAGGCAVDNVAITPAVAVAGWCTARPLWEPWERWGRGNVSSLLIGHQKLLIARSGAVEWV